MRLLLAAMVVLWPGAARACEGILEPIHSDIRHAYRIDPSCEQLEAAAKVLSVTATSMALGEWGYTGELDIREDLEKRYGIAFSTRVLPLGTIDRDPPEGPGELLVFGLEMPRRSWALLALTQHEGSVDTAHAAAVLGEGASYDWLGVYRKDGGKVDPKGEWLKLEAGGKWSDRRPAPMGETRACLACQGWLCGSDPIACFADLNLNGREETLLIDDCQPYACGLRVLEPDAQGKVLALFNEPGVYGDWTRRADGWALVAEVYCPWGEFCGEGDASLGNPNCERPDVYRFDARSGRLKPYPDLKDEYYPVKNKKAPGACVVDNPDGVVVYTKDKAFVRYLP